MVKQISLFMQNEPGRLAEATRAIANAGVNIRALVVADTETYGVLRFIADNTDKAVAVLKDAGFTIKLTEVIAVELKDQPGGLAGVLDILQANGVNVGYIYAFLKKSHENAVVIIRVDDPEQTIKILEKGGISALKGEDIYEA